MTPFYDRNGITIYCGDCLEVMPGLEPPFDAIMADLPYGTTACEWDSVIPLEPLWKEYKRLVKQNGAVVLNSSQPFTTTLINSNLEWFKYELIWEKNRLTNFYNTDFQPGKSHENVIVFSSGAASYSPNGNMTFNPQLEPGAPWKKKDISSGRHTYHAPKKQLERSNDGYRYPRSVLPFACEFEYHPTQKPVALMFYLIRTYTNPGELILDNTMGSGTTLVAAQNEGRRAVGIELSEEYCKIAVERLRQPSLFATPVQPNKRLQPNCYQSDFQTLLASDDTL